MNYYLAVDNMSSAKIPWRYFQLRGWKPENYLLDPEKHPLPTDFLMDLKIAHGCITVQQAFNILASQHKKRFNIYDVRVACMNYMESHKEAYCINILKRVRKNTYELIERIYRSGNSEKDEDVRGWDWITDDYFKDENTYEI